MSLHDMKIDKKFSKLGFLLVLLSAGTGTRDKEQENHFHYFGLNGKENEFSKQTITLISKYSYGR